MRQDILNVAIPYLGTTYDKDKNIIFNTEYYGKKLNAKRAYCVVFAWWAYLHAGYQPYFKDGLKENSCNDMISYYKVKHPFWVHKQLDRCKPGDMMVLTFNGNNHFALFETKTGKSTFNTIEGNTTNKAILGNNSNGGYVMRKARKMTNVKYFISPTLPEDRTCPYPKPTRSIKRGCKGEDVKWVQWWLTQKGFSCDIDGSFGPASEQQLYNFQTYYKAHLTVDKCCGKNTRAALEA